MRKILCILLLISSPAYAAWIKVGFSDESTIFIDGESVKRSGDRVRVLELMNFPLGTSVDDKSFKSAKTVEEFDCKNSSSKTVSFEWFSGVMGDGVRVYKDSGNIYPYTEIVKGSLREAVKMKVC